ncbi:chemotaxis protein CheW [Mobiluncus porci]|nr:chemotaxis protein CheW [Mobiluncus porci]
MMTQYVTFRLDGALYGIEVNQVTEILRGEDITNVPLSPEAITGLVNLRGQIATLIDLRKQLNLPPREDEENTMMVVVVLDGETLSLMVDSIGDVREVDESDFEAPPDTLAPELRELILGAYKLSDDLLLVLDVERVVAIGQEARAAEKTKEAPVV